MTLRMLWFLPVGIATGLSGLRIARQIVRQGGHRHRGGALTMLAITWMPLAAWLINQFFNVER